MKVHGSWRVYDVTTDRNLEALLILGDCMESMPDGGQSRRVSLTIGVGGVQKLTVWTDLEGLVSLAQEARRTLLAITEIL